LDAGADVNAMGGLFEWTLLHEAANVSRKEIVELLIAEGADVDARAFDGETPLDAAIHPIKSFNTVSKEITALLRKHGGKTSEELKAEGK
jgi:ankyrin repeat protein